MISVCMATYNGARFIKEQIDSILPQLSADDELIISDDGSTDGTLDIIASYNDERINVLNHIPKLNFSAHEKATENFENALSTAKGDFIFLSDQDDIWFPNKVSVCMERLKDFDFVVHKKSFIDEDGNQIQRCDSIQLPKNWFLHIVKMNWFGCCMAFKRNLLNKSLPFPYRLVGHDYFISTLAILFGKISMIDKPLIEYRLHNNSVSQGKHTSFFYKMSYRFELFKMILKRIHNIKRGRIN